MSAVDGAPSRPGSDGEHALQRSLGTADRADRFYDDQVLDHLNPRMREFVHQQEMFFLSTSDRRGECDSSFRAGPPGFLRVLDDRTLVYPEYRGNGVHASLGNIQENPHVGLLLIDFVRARIGLHINGGAVVVEDAELRAEVSDLPEDPVPGRRGTLWVRVTVEEAYIHCAKHIPHLQKAPKRAARDWGTDDYKRKGGDFFGAAREARERRAEAKRAIPQPDPQQPQPQPQSDPGPQPSPQPRRAPSHAAPPTPQPHAHPQAHPQAQPEIPLQPRAPLPPSPPNPAPNPAAPAPAVAPAPVASVSVWQKEAERALAEARRRGEEQRERAPFQGWFG
ncbi:pyridoxamine 5'-phosphate oxidase family protein [Streptomyces albiaxialis]|uniref:pyridoxamine 5'-phosphate oxidase family protein n=1 Tax=Streptomyces albiaxialis TaxID=329523 RepID=UPI0031D2734B